MLYNRKANSYFSSLIFLFPIFFCFRCPCAASNHPASNPLGASRCGEIYKREGRRTRRETLWPTEFRHGASKRSVLFSSRPASTEYTACWRINGCSVRMDLRNSRAHCPGFAIIAREMNVNRQPEIILWTSKRYSGGANLLYLHDLRMENATKCVGNLFVWTVFIAVTAGFWVDVLCSGNWNGGLICYLQGICVRTEIVVGDVIVILILIRRESFILS